MPQSSIHGDLQARTRSVDERGSQHAAGSLDSAIKLESPSRDDYTERKREAKDKASYGVVDNTVDVAKMSRHTDLEVLKVEESVAGCSSRLAEDSKKVSVYSYLKKH